MHRREIGSAEAATPEALELARQYGAWPAITALAAWRRRCGIVEAVPSGTTGPYRMELAGDIAAAAAAWRELGCEHEAAVMLCCRGAEADLRRALAAFHALETRPAAAIAARLLRERGARRVPRGSRPSTRSHGGRWTTREIEVLGLVAPNLPNRDIANRLHCRKTVDHHVAAIIAKLGVSNRRQAVSAAARYGEVAAPR